MKEKKLPTQIELHINEGEITVQQAINNLDKAVGIIGNKVNEIIQYLESEQ